MVEKNRGISPDLLIHPGETILDLLEERGLSQKELAKRVGVSEAFLSDVINGKKDISKGLAMGLEYAFDISSSFWLTLQANYDSELLSLQEETSIQEEEKTVLSHIHEVVAFLKRHSFIDEDITQDETVLALRKILHVSNLNVLSSLAPSGSFRLAEKAKINDYVLGAWLCLCKSQKSSVNIKTSFQKDEIDDLIKELKGVMTSSNRDLQKVLKVVFAKYGIDFSFMPNFRGAPVHGYIALKDNGVYQMALTLRGSYADIIWFSLFHELGHIINGDVSKVGGYIDTEHSTNKRKETAANRFACDSLLDANSYKAFIINGVYSYDAIKVFAETQNVPPYIVIGRLQKEEVIPWSWYNKYKLRYKWAEQ